MPPAYEILLLNTAVPQIQAAQSGDTYVVPRDIAFSAALTLSAGTANGVPYLNGSKVLTTGSALTYNGTNLFSLTSGAIRLTDAFELGWGANSVFLTGSSASNTLQFITNSAEQMRLTSTGLGIGTSSTTNGRLTVNAGTSATGNSLLLQNIDGTINPYVQVQHSSAGVRFVVGNSYSSANNNLIFGSTTTLNGMTLDDSGNLGLGVTPSAWASGYKVFQFGNSATTVGCLFANGPNDMWSASNVYFDGSVFRYIASSTATGYEQFNGSHIWSTAPSGTAGDAISFTHAMTLGADGLLQIGTTTGTVLDGKLQVSATGTGAGAANTVVGLNVFEETSGNKAGLWFGAMTNSNVGVIGARTGSGSIAFQTYNGSSWGERARITSGGNFKIGGSADRATTEGDKQLVLFDGTAPVGTLANGVSFYSASGEANVMDAAGNATLLSPHDAETNEWIFRSKHTPTGKVLKIDVERMLKFVNDHFGLDAVHEFIEE